MPLFWAAREGEIRTEIAEIWIIQYLRAVAALAVAAFHFAVPTGVSFEVGAFGIDLFFVISGFIMWTLTERRRSPGEFLARRIARIVPTYWILTFAFFACAYIRPWIVALHDPPTVSDLVLSLSFAPTARYPIIGQGWTLNVEMFFYAIFAATLPLTRWGQLLALSSVLSMLSILAVVFGYGDARPFYLLNFQLVEFAAGLLIGEMWLRKVTVASWRGVALIAVGFALVSLRWWINFPQLIGPYVLASALIVFGSISIEAEGKVPRWTWLRRVGDASYLIYLTHFPVVQLTLYATAMLPLAVRFVLVLTGSTLLGLALLPIERRLILVVRDRLLSR